jgi:hypothetical protein
VNLDLHEDDEEGTGVIAELNNEQSRRYPDDA